MHPAIPHLLELQRADQRIAALRSQLQSLPIRIREADAKLSGARQELASAKQAHRLIEAEQAARQKELEGALAEREAALAPVPEDLRELYSRIAKRHRGIVLAEARKEQCLACGMRVLPHIYQELRRESNHEVF